MEQKLKQIIQDMPKAENHVHLEGAISPALLLELGEKNKVRLPFDTQDGAVQYIQENTKSLDTFINVFNVVNTVLRDGEDFYRLVMDFAAAAAAENIIYREAMIDFPVHSHVGVSEEVVVDGLSSGHNEALTKYGVDLQFIAELDRSMDGASALAFVKRLESYRKWMPIVAVGWALGLKGREEDNFTAKEHQEAFQLAHEMGLMRTAHCGEAQGPESVRDVLEHLDVERIDHGVRSIEDESLIMELKKRQILLAMCPSSNVMIGLYPDLSAHPLKQFIKQGIPVSISTDDPAYLKGGLSDEIYQVTKAQNLDLAAVLSLVRNSFRYSFAGEKYMEKLESWIQKQGLA